MKPFGHWMQETTRELAERTGQDTIPGLEHTPWVGNTQPPAEKKPWRPDVIRCDDPFDDDEDDFPAGSTEDFVDSATYSSLKKYWEAPCRVCQRDTEICCEPEEFVADEHYCGGSPACCP